MTLTELVRRSLSGLPGQIAVTGATGWFGAVALDLLYEALGEAAPDRVRAYASRASRTTVSDGRGVAVHPLSDLVTDPGRLGALLHFAYLTRERSTELGVDAYVAANVAITSTVVEAVARRRPSAVLVTSSGAVYRRDGGLVDDLRGNPYGALKRLDELVFQGVCAQAGAALVVPRVFSVAGPHMTKPERYALGSMIMQARAGGPVRVNADHPVVRAYCGVDEVVALALAASAAGRTMVLDSAGSPVEVGELASRVVAVLGGGPVERPGVRAEPQDVYVPDPAAMQGLAVDHGVRLRDLDELIEVTARGLR